MDEYRIRPALIFDYKLERRVLWVFWSYVSGSDDFDHLVKVVKKVGGKLAYPSPQQQEMK